MDLTQHISDVRLANAAMKENCTVKKLYFGVYVRLSKNLKICLCNSQSDVRFFNLRSNDSQYMHNYVEIFSHANYVTIIQKYIPAGKFYLLT